MAVLGKYNSLRVVKEVSFGVYLDGGVDGEILLPSKYVPGGCRPGDELRVFIYLDSEDDFIATTRKPLAQVGEFALLKAVSVNKVGAFLDWGLEKDLLVPFSEQTVRMQEGRSYVVYVTVDHTDRIIGSAKLDKFLDNEPPTYHEGEEVALLICESTEMGTKAIINNHHWGLLHTSDVFERLQYGSRTRGYIKRIQPDGKIDLHFHKPGRAKHDDCAEKVLVALREQGGFLPLSDKSPPEAIYAQFGESKKTFKAAIGGLYKQRLIRIDDDGIRLVDA